MVHDGSRIVSGQVPAGKGGDNFEIMRVFVIGLLDFMLWDDPILLADPVLRYLRSADVSWTDTREPMGKVKWIFIQLPGFTKKLEELKTDLDRWIYLMNNLHQIEEPPASFQAPAFQKLFNVNKLENLKPEEQKMYKLSFDTAREWRNVISYAKSEGEAIGEKRGERNKELIVTQTMIMETDFDDQRIASLAKVKESFVRKIRAERSQEM